MYCDRHMTCPYLWLQCCNHRMFCRRWAFSGIWIQRPYKLRRDDDRVKYTFIDFPVIFSETLIFYNLFCFRVPMATIMEHKETMMESLMKLPDDMFNQEILQYLTLDNIVKLNNACMNHKHWSQLLEKIDGVILVGDKDERIKDSLFKWLGMRQIYLIKMLILEYDFASSWFTHLG